MSDCRWYSHYSQLILSVFLEHINYCDLKQLNFTSRPTDSEFLEEGFCSAFLASTVGYSDTELPQAMFRKSVSIADDSMFQTSCSTYLTNLATYREVLSGIPLGLIVVYTHNRGFPGGRIHLLILANTGATGLIPG